MTLNHLVVHFFIRAIIIHKCSCCYGNLISMTTRILMNNFVFFSQEKFIFGTLGKQKSINYFVAMETLFPCYSPGDVLVWYICSLGQQTSDIRKFPQEQVIWLKISL